MNRHPVKELEPVTASRLEKVLKRIDNVLERNRRLESVLIVCSLTLFLIGVSGIVLALITGNWLYGVPQTFTSLFILHPLWRLTDLRRKKLALSIAPALIDLIDDPAEATAEVKNLLNMLLNK